MGRLTARAPVVKLSLDGASRRRADTLVVEEPLEIRVGGRPLTVTMRTPGHDVELAAGFLVSEGVISHGGQFAAAVHCGGPGTGGPGATGTDAAGSAVAGPSLRVLGTASADGNTYNVLDVTLAPGVAPPAADLARNFYTTSSCGVCGKASIEAVATVSSYDLSTDTVAVDPGMLVDLPDRLRAEQAVFDKTGDCTRRAFSTSPRARCSSCARTWAGTTPWTRWSGGRLSATGFRCAGQR